MIAIHTEYDANPSNSQKSGVAERAEIVPDAPGHCEGHNTNAAVMITSALAIRYAMERFSLPGTLKIFGASAEEQLLSRPYFVRDGLFDDVDLAFHDHILDRVRHRLRRDPERRRSRPSSRFAARPRMPRCRPGKAATRSMRWC